MRSGFGSMQYGLYCIKFSPIARVLLMLPASTKATPQKEIIKSNKWAASTLEHNAFSSG